MAPEQDISDPIDTAQWQNLLSEANFDESFDTFGQLVGVERYVRGLQLDALGQMINCEGASPKSIACELSVKVGLTNKEATERVQVAAAVSAMPLLRDAYVKGDINWTKLALVCELAGESTDELHWLELAMTNSINQIRLQVKQKKVADAGSDRPDVDAQKDFTVRHFPERGVSKITSVVPIEDGIEIEEAVNKVADSYPADIQTGMYMPYSSSHSDALCELILGANKPHIEIAVEVDRDNADMEGQPLLLEALRRLACDASVRPVFTGSDGTLGVGRTARLAPTWLEKRVKKRDRGCRFPNCLRVSGSHIHHMLEWEADCGPTDLDNLIELCPSHHRYVHEGGWKIRGCADGELEFVAPNGQVYYGRAPQADAQVVKRVQNLAIGFIADAVANRKPEPPAYVPPPIIVEDDVDVDPIEDVYPSTASASWADDSWAAS